MTNEQHFTATQIIKEYQDLFYEKPSIVDMGDRKITLTRNGPVLHPHYKMLKNGSILFGVGTEYTEYGMPVIGINSWKIITSNGAIIDSAEYSQYEKELTQQSVEISSFNSGGNLIRFI